MPDPILRAVSWADRVLSGAVATSVCVIAVASIGLLMLTGRIDQRRALAALIGCFLIFGAGSIAAGLLGVQVDQSIGVEPASTAPPPIDAKPPPPFDPYAGASPMPRPVSKDEARRAP